MKIIKREISVTCFKLLIEKLIINNMLKNLYLRTYSNTLSEDNLDDLPIF